MYLFSLAFLARRSLARASRERARAGADAAPVRRQERRLQQYAPACATNAPLWRSESGSTSRASVARGTRSGRRGDPAFAALLEGGHAAATTAARGLASGD